MVLTDADYIINHRLPNLFLYLGQSSNMKEITLAFKERKKVCNTKTHVVYISCPLFETDPNWHSPEALALFEAIQELEAETVALYSLCEFPTFLLYSFFMLGKLKELVIYSDVTFIGSTTKKGEQLDSDYFLRLESVDVRRKPRVKKLKLHLDNANGMTGWLAFLTDPIIGKNIFKEICLLGAFQEVFKEEEDESYVRNNKNPSTACKTYDWTTWQAVLFWKCLVQLKCERMNLQSFLDFHPNFLTVLVENASCLKRLTTFKVRVDCRLMDAVCCNGDDGIWAPPSSMEDLLESNYTLESIKVKNLGHDGLNSFWNDLAQECQFYLELNRKGRRTFLQQDWQNITRKHWVDALIEFKDDVPSLFYLLVRNPSLCHDANPTFSCSGHETQPTLGEVLEERRLVSCKASTASCLKQINADHCDWTGEHDATSSQDDNHNAPILREEEHAELRVKKGRHFGWSNRNKPTMRQLRRYVSSLFR